MSGFLNYLIRFQEKEVKEEEVVMEAETQEEEQEKASLAPVLSMPDNLGSGQFQTNDRALLNVLLCFLVLSQELAPEQRAQFEAAFGNELKRLQEVLNTKMGEQQEVFLQKVAALEQTVAEGQKGGGKKR